MNKLTINVNKNDFDILKTFDCGQCFRFDREKCENGVSYHGVAQGRYVRIVQTSNEVTIFAENAENEKDLWYRFFDLYTDYDEMDKTFTDDKNLVSAMNYSKGIRLLKQDSWEALCSFIISQNNNIPRIKGIISKMSEKYGKLVYTDNEGNNFYSFPQPEMLYNAGTDEIFALKTGFRAKYIYDAAKKVCENPFYLTEVSSLDTKTAVEKLKEICGVGDKVASCTLLFGFSRYDAFPIDVWVKRILSEYYPCGITPPLSGKYAGLAQQYLFYYERCKNNVFINNER